MSEVYQSTRNFIASKDEALAEVLHKNLGFSTGCNLKETVLEIGPNNHEVIKPNMVFHTRVTFQSGDIVVAIGDTVHVQASGVEPMTGNVPKEYAKISFILEEDDDAEEQKNDDNRETLATSSALNPIGHKRTRAGRAGNASVKDKISFEERIKKSQNELLDKNLEELKKRYEDGEI